MTSTISPFWAAEVDYRLARATEGYRGPRAGLSARFRRHGRRPGRGHRVPRRPVLTLPPSRRRPAATALGR